MTAFTMAVPELSGTEIDQVSGGGVIEDAGAAIGGALGARFGARGAAVGAIAGGFLGRQVERTDGNAVVHGIANSSLRNRVSSGV